MMTQKEKVQEDLTIQWTMEKIVQSMNGDNLDL